MTTRVRQRGPVLLLRTPGLAAALILTSTLGSGCGVFGTGPDSDNLAEYHAAPVSNAVADQYVVILASDSPDPAVVAKELVAEARGELLVVYDGVLRGFAARVPNAGVERLRVDPRVSRVYQDLWLAFSSAGAGTQLMDENGDPWGLDRIDQRSRVLDREYVYTATGLDVTVYVVDSGLDVGHLDFDGRATNLKLTEGQFACAEDELGHGTAVGSIVGGRTYGVAKDTKLVGLRVAPCGDPRPLFSLVLKAVDWLATPGNRDVPAVINFSLGWRLANPIDPWRIAIEDLIKEILGEGVPFITSANNVGGDACEWWPAYLVGTITVAGTYQGDVRVEDSNWGPCVDLFAPGIDLLAAAPGGGSRYRRGTSFAAPHVAGAAALLLERTPALDAVELKGQLLDNATAGAVSDAGVGSPDLLLFVR